MTAERSPLWLLLGDKLGDNAQVTAIAQSLPIPCLRKTVLPKPEWVLGKPSFRPGLEHLDMARSDPLEPPWPELIVTIGRRPSMAALWVQEQSGGRTKLVIVGRPKRWPERFALIVAPAQYDVPPAANVLQLDLPLMRPDERALAAAAEAWAPRLAGLPRPLTAVLVGGETKPYRFDAATEADLTAKLRDLVARDGGTLYVTTSRRTQPAVVEALAAGLPPGAKLYRWQAGAPAADNPYAGLMALAERFVVTGDSISMMVEVARAGRPLAIYPLPVRGDPLTRARLRLGSMLGSEGSLAALGQLARGAGIMGFARDLGRIHDRLVARGLAVRLGQPFLPAGATAADELAVVRAALLRLLPSAEVAV